MNITDIRRFEMLVRVKDFGDEYAETFKATPQGMHMFAEVADSVSKLRDQGATQSSQTHGVKDSTTSKAVVRAALAVNRELVLLYWSIGRDILTRQKEQGWGAISEGLAIAGSIVTVSGLILLIQDATAHYESWAYAWALVFPGAG